MTSLILRLQQSPSGVPDQRKADTKQVEGGRDGEGDRQGGNERGRDGGRDRTLTELSVGITAS